MGGTYADVTIFCELFWFDEVYIPPKGMKYLTEFNLQNPLLLIISYYNPSNNYLENLLSISHLQK